MSMREDENAFSETLVLDGAAGAVASELVSVVNLVVVIGEALSAASMATTPNL